jgi:hypothetical protein
MSIQVKTKSTLGQKKMFPIVVSYILPQQVKEERKKTRSSPIDIQALQLFPILATLVLPSCEFDCIFHSLRRWETQLVD